MTLNEWIQSHLGKCAPITLEPDEIWSDWLEPDPVTGDLVLVSSITRRRTVAADGTVTYEKVDDHDA